ncbi:MAG: hypothetical protein K6E35_07505 [Bacteroidales bacterium]|nr:hypothetical protein [Bacteroidales bacterium]
MKKFLPIVLLAILVSSCSVARYARGPESRDIESLPGYDGIIETVTYTSSEPGLSERRMVVYLPQEYYQDSLRRYPVMYLLHGARGNEKTWIDSADVFHCIDTLRRAGKAADFILVMPNMNNYRSDKDYKNGRAIPAVRAFFTVNGEVERYFVQDVVDRMDSLYRTVAKKSGRAVAGMSCGALQTIYLSANHPNTFAYVGLFSPYTYPTFAAKYHQDVYGGLWWKLERQFSVPPILYALYIGKTDFFYPHILLFDRKLTRKGYAHELVVNPGGHEWYNWSDFLEDFSQKIFR